MKPAEVPIPIGGQYGIPIAGTNHMNALEFSQVKPVQTAFLNFFSSEDIVQGASEMFLPAMRHHHQKVLGRDPSLGTPFQAVV